MPTESEADVVQLKLELIRQKADQIVDIDSFNAHFVTLSEALVGSNVIDKKTVLLVDTLAIWFVRAQQLLRLEATKPNSNGPEVFALYCYICDHYESGSGAFTNALNGLLLRLLVYAQTLPQTANLDVTDWVSKVMALANTQKGFYHIIGALMKEMPGTAIEIEKNHPNFKADTFGLFWSSGLANAASRALKSYFALLYPPKQNPSKYIDAWTPLVVKNLHSETQRKNTMTYLVPALFKDIPHAYAPWVQALVIDRTSKAGAIIILGLLNAGHTFGATNLEDYITEEDMKKFLSHPDHTARLEALSALCTPTVPLQIALALLLESLILDIFFKESATPEARVAFLSSFKKFLASLRDYNKKKKKTPELGSKIIPTISSISQYVQESLTATASYSQLVVVTDILQFFADMHSDETGLNVALDIDLTLFSVYTVEFARVLMRFTTNNYEDIRERASLILYSCPYEIFTEASDPTLLHNSMQLLLSLKGRTSDAGANLFATVAYVHQKNNNVRGFIKTLQSLMVLKTEAIAKDLPIHGYLTAISKIISIAYEDTLHKELKYFEVVFTSLLHTITQLWNIAKPVMTTIDEVDSKSSVDAWRTIKESSLLLRTLMVVNFNSSWAFFTKDQFLGFCTIVRDQLTEVSHRGAFSAVFPTYVQACEICLACDLQGVPFSWMQSDIRLLKTKEQLISRRSAGLPFLFLGVLDAASISGETLAEYMDYTMKGLLAIARSSYSVDSEETNDIPQVHAYNCMRQIFKDSKLKSGISQFVNDALELSLQHLCNPTWAIKNGALMLFTSIQDYLFGTNKMGQMLPSTSANIFFAKYPGISDVLLDYLKHPKTEIGNDVILVLSVLSRLNATSAEDKHVEVFIDVLGEQYLNHKSWKIREMSARLIAAITHPSSIAAKVSELLTFCDPSRSDTAQHSANQEHGALLTVLELVKTYKRKVVEFSEMHSIAKVLDERVCSMLQDAMDSQTSKWVLLKCHLDILAELEWTLSPKARNELELLLFASLGDSKSLNGARNLFFKAAVRTLMSSCSKDHLTILGKRVLVSKNSDAQLTMIELFMIQIDNFKMLTDLHEICWELISNEKVWIHVKETLLSLLSQANIVPPRKCTVSLNCNDVMKCTFLSTLEGEDFLGSFRKYSAFDSEENLRFLSLKAAKDAPREGFLDSSAAAQTDLIIFWKFFDASEKVRCLAASGQCVTASSLRYLDGYFEKHKAAGITAVIIDIRESIQKDLDTVAMELSNPDFDIEREDLFIDEVEVHKMMVQKLSAGMEEYPDLKRTLAVDCTRAVDFLCDYITKHEDLIQQWQFNVHLDSAIRKAKNFLQFTEARNIKEALSKLGEILERTGYP